MLAEQLDAIVSFLTDRFGPCPHLGMVLGSGLGAFADSLDDAASVSYDEIPHCSAGAVAGHKGRLVVGSLRGIRLLCLQGRRHLYEGIEASEAVLMVRAIARWGVRAVVLTNAAGGIAPKLKVGDLMLITDHLNLTGRNPLVGPNEETLGPRFPAMNDAYDTELSAALLEAALHGPGTLQQGVYAALLGPNYETPAEIRMLHTLGADAVGMSTVHETIALRHMGVRVVGISCITNAAAGLSEEAPDHEEVMETGRQVADRFAATLAAAVPELAELISHTETSRGNP